jgi:hypothetical protein
MKDIQRAGHLLAQTVASLEADFVQQSGGRIENDFRTNKTPLPPFH